MASLEAKGAQPDTIIVQPGGASSRTRPHPTPSLVTTSELAKLAHISGEMLGLESVRRLGDPVGKLRTALGGQPPGTESFSNPHGDVGRTQRDDLLCPLVSRVRPIGQQDQDRSRPLG